MFKEQQEKFRRFQVYVRDNMVPIKEIVFGPKRLDQREREIEVERATRSYKNAADKKAVAFLADLKIDIRERQEAITDLNKTRLVGEDGQLGDFAWDKAETRQKFTAFIEYMTEESEKGRRKMIEQWDHYAIARDSKFNWKAVEQYKRSKTFEHGGDSVPTHELKELTMEEKDEKLKKAEKDSKFKQINVPSGGKAKGSGSRYSSGQSSFRGKKVEFVWFLHSTFLYIYFYDDACMTTFA